MTTRLRDDAGRWEQVFIRVRALDGKTIQGTISNEIRTVSGFKHGDEYSFHQRELIHWLIARPDGTEEGNFVGKFLDEYHKEQGR